MLKKADCLIFKPDDNVNEALFHLSECVNKHDTRYWSNQNPKELHPISPFTALKWQCGVLFRQSESLDPKLFLSRSWRKQLAWAHSDMCTCKTTLLPIIRGNRNWQRISLLHARWSHSSHITHIHDNSQELFWILFELKIWWHILFSSLTGLKVFVTFSCGEILGLPTRSWSLKVYESKFARLLKNRWSFPHVEESVCKIFQANSSLF